ncbi:MAG: hypothetical protein K8F25_16675, partial [Fimbriimonadaceae bacterium]|nr:hypothetical protein [Alphaproteobacteria bacterium]
GVTIREVTGRAVVSVAAPRGGGDKLAKAIFSAYKTAIPAVGQSAVSKDTDARLLGMRPNQFFLLFDPSGANPVDEVAKKLAAAAYLTDQSDAWVMFSISGPNARSMLARICTIDLHSDVFREDQVARTMIEHLSATIIRETGDKFLLLSPRSSAKSFLHALETSARNVARLQ